MFQEIKDWEVQRLGKFTASEMHKLLQSGKKKDEYFGKTALSYIDEKIAELITGQPSKDLTGLNALEWGAAHELEALNALQDRLDLPIEIFGGSNNKFFQYNDYSGGSPDGLTEKHLIEVKCPYNSAIHAKNLIASFKGETNDWLKENRTEYFVQMQFNMMCTGREMGLFISYDPRPIEQEHRLAAIIIYPDIEMQKNISERIERAAELVSDSLQILSTPPSIIIVSRDEALNATIIT